MSQRLALLTLDERLLTALLEHRDGDVEAALDVRITGGWPETDLDAVRIFRNDLRSDPSLQSWLLRVAVHRDDRVVVGHVGFHSRPGSDGTAEVGYTIFASHQRKGYAREAVVALMQWARKHGARSFRAAVKEPNAASVALLESLGFERTGEQIDEIDGLEAVFVRS